MEEWFKAIAGSIALGVEASAALIIAAGAVEAVYLLIRRVIEPAAGSPVLRKKGIWVRFAVWLLLGLEFELAADVVRTAIAPSWDAIGQLAAIAVIRTFLNFFLEKDIEKYEEPVKAPASYVVAAPLA
jgi:uncharacterized membrane protein